MKRSYAVMVLVWLVLGPAVVWSAEEPVHIMLANDDGIDSPGLVAIAEAIAADPAYRLTVVAPARQQSAMGHALKIRGEIEVREHEGIAGAPAWSVDATPASVVRLGLTALLAVLVVAAITIPLVQKNRALEVLEAQVQAAAAQQSKVRLPQGGVGRVLDVDRVPFHRLRQSLAVVRRRHSLAIGIDHLPHPVSRLLVYLADTQLLVDQAMELLPVGCSGDAHVETGVDEVLD